MAFINGKKILTIIKGGGGSTGGGSTGGGNEIELTTLAGTTWKLKEPFNTDEEQLAYNINFISNNEKFIGFLYVPEQGLFYIDENENIVTIYNEIAKVFNGNEEYKTLKITGGADATNKYAIDALKHTANLISVDGGGSTGGGSTGTSANIAAKCRVNTLTITNANVSIVDDNTIKLEV